MFSQGESGDGPATVMQEKFEDGELLGGKGQKFAVFGDLAADGIEADIARPR